MGLLHHKSGTVHTPARIAAFLVASLKETDACQAPFIAPGPLGLDPQLPSRMLQMPNLHLGPSPPCSVRSSGVRHQRPCRNGGHQSAQKLLLRFHSMRAALSS